MAIVAVTALFEGRAVRQRWVHRLTLAFFGAGVLASGSRASALSLAAVAGWRALTHRRVNSRLGADLTLGVMWVAS